MVALSKLIPSARGLFVFEAAARTGSFTVTAGEFNVTQPSISRTIAQFEAELGMRLFDRGPKGLALTDDGRVLYAAVREGLSQVRDTIFMIQDQKKASKPLVTLSLSSSFVTHWLVSRLGDFNATFPNVDLRFDLIAGVMRGMPDNVDLGTRIVPDDDTQYHRWDFSPEIILPVCSPSYLRAHGKLDHDGDGDGHVFLHLTDHRLQQWADVWGNVANRKTAKGTWLEFSDYAVILQAALNGEGVALGWLSVTSTALLKGILVPASDRLINTGRHHRLIAPRSRPLRPVVAEIANWLRSQMMEDVHALQPLLQSTVTHN
jgi:LysR family glycine cleavage system transcriptional activator